MIEPIVAYFHDGPLQGQSYALPKFTDRYMVPMPPRRPVYTEAFGLTGHTFDTGVYVVDHHSVRYGSPQSLRNPTFTYYWKGTNNMGIADNIHRLTGRRPTTLKHVSECDEVIIDGRALDDLIRLAEPRAPRRQSFEVTASVDGEPLPLLLIAVDGSCSDTFDLPVRRVGQPHRLTVTVKPRA